MIVISPAVSAPPVAAPASGEEMDGPYRRAAVPTAPTAAIPVTYVPARNTIFLALALGFAEARDAYHSAVQPHVLAPEFRHARFHQIGCAIS